MPLDPVCGMVVPKDSHVACSDYNNQHYCFCSMECKEEFDMDPEVFIYDYEEADYEQQRT
jgi:YHS domain-containing protein